MSDEHTVKSNGGGQFKKKQLIGNKRKRVLEDDIIEEDIVSMLEKNADKNSNNQGDLNTRDSKIS